MLCQKHPYTDEKPEYLNINAENTEKESIKEKLSYKYMALILVEPEFAMLFPIVPFYFKFLTKLPRPFQNLARLSTIRAAFPALSDLLFFVKSKYSFKRTHVRPWGACVGLGLGVIFVKLR